MGLTTFVLFVCPAIKVGSYADPGAVRGYPTSQMRGPCVASVTYCKGRSRRAGVGVQLVTPSPECPSQHSHAKPPDASAQQSVRQAYQLYRCHTETCNQRVTYHLRRR